ncbi:MAG: response regulator transcription factor [Pseudomonas sp.]|nr:response regulator transcription factor [Pseudomonas sp.]
MDKILVVDDEPFIVEELVEFFESAGLHCIGCTSSSEAVRIFHEDEHISIVLSDYRMPEVNGIQLIEMLNRSKRKERVLGSILFTGDADKEDIVAALRAGISDYYSKPLDLDALLDGVKKLQQTLISQRKVMSAQLITDRLSEMTSTLLDLQAGVDKWNTGLDDVDSSGKTVSSQQAAVPGLSLLSPRQVEVAQLIGQGMTNYQIACELGISENTVKLYVSQVLKATNMPSRTRLAIALGLGASLS